MGVLLESLLPDASALALPARREAAAALLRDGLPLGREEAWKYTSLRALDQRRYVAGDPQAATRSVDAAAFDLPGIDGPRLVFVNGVFQAAASDRPEVAGLDLLALSEHPGALSGLLEDSAAGARADAFVRLNTALVADGAYVRVAAGVQVAAPLHLVFIGAPADADLAWQARLRIELGTGAALRVVEHHLGSGAHRHLGNLVSDSRLADGARLELLQLQDVPETSVLVRRSTFRLERDARLVATTLEAGAQLARHEFRVHLAGRGARFESRGVFVLHGRQHADTRLDVWHEARDTACDVAWRGVADERARGVFHGAITIQPGADGADATLTNKNLLLSPQAEIDSQPVLEIHADEVKAAHGATVGQLDEHALFYLRTRGIAPDAARRILVAAFCSAMLDELAPAALRERLDGLLADRLPSAMESQP
ncbi:Fe-S cluster assembly protein SufD [Dokdonella sp.]|uniref:Fe-S cluster assembly protein SufD n=1 Tax=Dokdonella sp. TaxID=2291710 RepID=UPI0031C84877|nr:Fe-S cluster assembly protein SufD [Dokdonella sp.]